MQETVQAIRANPVNASNPVRKRSGPVGIAKAQGRISDEGVVVTISKSMGKLPVPIPEIWTTLDTTIS